ncbi:MAG: branched-chain amino acid aminotransferase [Gemmatimonadales bacterium]|nr:branched-chain amino acid aminotransferase [Gemmatimonadales bacterium]
MTSTLEPRAAIAVHPVAAPRPLPDPATLGFGRIFSDHMFVAEWADGRWHDGRVVPHAPLALDPAAAALHYAQAIFDGHKAYRGADGVVRFFRLADHARRFARSAAGLCMPAFPEALYADALHAIVRADERWVPSVRGTSLYLRPTMIGTEGFLGVRPASTYTMFVICSPVGSYYGGDALRAVRLWVETDMVRAAKGGIGQYKAAANYAASLRAGEAAKARGYDQVLWLDAARHEGLEEVGTMNLFVRFRDEVATPPLDGTILPGITRDSVLKLLAHWGVPHRERAVSLAELRAAHAKGDVLEVFGSGTAAVISPVGALGTAAGELVIGDGGPGELAKRLYAAITGIQYGEQDDPFGWMTVLG